MIHEITYECKCKQKNLWQNMMRDDSWRASVGYEDLWTDETDEEDRMLAKLPWTCAVYLNAFPNPGKKKSHTRVLEGVKQESTWKKISFKACDTNKQSGQAASPVA